ncbi:hypothetical protein U9R62_04950 [Cylindrospermopsis raciborskii DSH]|uniref:hypothetical protein n=1 Tax=Cylindrospermopsis raciborskii TaxID=77022 RepID=UPI002ED989BD
MLREDWGVFKKYPQTMRSLPLNIAINGNSSTPDIPTTGDCKALPTGDRRFCVQFESTHAWRLSVGETGNLFPVSKLKSVEN